jgi:hypothetical protein
MAGADFLRFAVGGLTDSVEAAGSVGISGIQAILRTVDMVS